MVQVCVTQKPGQEEAKALRMKDGTMAMMTFGDVSKRFAGMLRGKARNWSTKYEFDELYQTALIALWKAYGKYDASIVNVPFGAYAGKFIDYDLLAFNRKNRSKCNNQSSWVKKVVSLNDIVLDDKGDGMELEELIGEEDEDLVQSADRMVLDRLLKKFTERQRQDILDYVDGYKNAELAEANDLSRRIQGERMRASFIKFRMLFIKEGLTT